MDRQTLKKYLFQDVEFEYKGKDASFCPVGGVFGVMYDGDCRDFDDFDEAIDEPMFDGKSLLEIWDDVEY